MLDVTIFREIVRNVVTAQSRRPREAARKRKEWPMYFIALIAFVAASVLFGLWTGW
jgi:hypothetical protein